MFKNKGLRRKFGQEANQVRGEWRKLHNGEIYNFYFSLNISKVIKLTSDIIKTG
jgi:hypothetical protein